MKETFTNLAVGNIVFLLAAAFHGYSDLVPLPLTIAMMTTAIIGYVMALMFLIDGASALVTDLRNKRESK